MRTNSSKTTKLQVSSSEMVKHAIDTMAERGIFGRNRSDVANQILNMWLWDNAEKLSHQGIHLQLGEY